MLLRQTRMLSTAEKLELIAGLPWLALRARREARAGEVEVLTFEVRRVWTLISCRGPSCCPNTWLIDTGDEFVFVRSWQWLGYDGENFPGSQVAIELLPRTRRVLTATATGTCIPVLPEPERSWEIFDMPAEDCGVLARAEVHLAKPG